MSSGDAIEINDLRNPSFTPAERERIDYAKRNPVTLEEDVILQAACENTALSDFGSDDCLERMRYWISITSGNDNLTEIARHGVYNQCLQAASDRLRLRSLLSNHPEIRDVSVRKPIIIAGPNRSGTSHLHGLVAADSRLCAVTMEESPRLLDTAGYPNESMQSANLRVARGLSLIPNDPMRAMVPLEASDPIEDSRLLAPDFPVGLWEFKGSFPRWGRFLQRDQTPHYKYMRTMLQAIQWQRGETPQWVLKDPLHSTQIVPLLRTFPDAVIVLTHRDPVAILQSVATMRAYTARIHYNKFEIDEILEAWAQRIEKMLLAIIRDKELIPTENLVEVSFQEFMTDKLETVRRIYSAAGLEFTKDTYEHKEEFIGRHRRGKYGKVIYDLRRDFDADPLDLRSRFEFYYSRYPVPFEVE